MALKGPGKTLKSSPYGDPTKASKGSPYGKLPTKSSKKSKKDTSGANDSGTSSNNAAGEGVPLMDVFSVLADENGRITSANLRKYVKDLELDFTEEEIKDMMAVVDPAGKGEISYSNLLGVVRDFSHEFPTVQLTSEELSRELTYESIVTESSSLEKVSIEDETEEPGTSTEDIDNSEEIEIDNEESESVSRPRSSRARIAEIAKRAIEDLDKMSVIREDDEYEEENEEEETEQDKVENETETNVLKDGENAEGEDEVFDSSNENERQATDDDKSETPGGETVASELAEDLTLVNDDIINANEDNISVNDPEIRDKETAPSRASTVKEHRLDSGISTAVGRMNIEEKSNTENGRRSRRRSTSETRTKSRRDSIKGDTSRKSSLRSRERSNSRSRKPDEKSKPRQPERRKSVPRRKFNGVSDPEFYSTMGCSLKLSQIRTRQRLLYVMWRAVYDQALRKMEQEQAKHQAQKRRKSQRRSVTTIS